MWARYAGQAHREHGAPPRAASDDDEGRLVGVDRSGRELGEEELVTCHIWNGQIWNGQIWNGRDCCAFRAQGAGERAAEAEEARGGR
eukprot:5110543-Prymnesium_polylepis.1